MKKGILLGLWIVFLSARCVVGAGSESAQAVSPEANDSKVEFGGDLRVRQVYFDNIPTTRRGVPEARGGVNHFFRYRTRLWTKINFREDCTLKVRLVNENRHYETEDSIGANNWNAMDETIVDQLYLDLNNLWDGNLDLRIGRQDLIYGTGKVILDGTPKDGPRTIYFDAVKAVYKGFENTTLDLLGIYNNSENELAIHRENRDLNGPTGLPYEGFEAGGGIYLKNNSLKAMPLEAYYLFKHENKHWDVFPTNIPPVLRDNSDLHTVGLRLMPKFSDEVSGNLETAFQCGGSGGNDVAAFMIDSQIAWQMPSLAAVEGNLGLGWYYLSGNDPSTSKDEGWNPIWSRWPQYSELYVYAYDYEGAGRWSNLSLPHLDLTLKLHPKWQTSFLLGYMFAPQKNGTGPGDERGLLATMWNRFNLKKNLFAEGDSLDGHILCELVEPGNYYAQNETALFARWELAYSF